MAWRSLPLLYVFDNSNIINVVILIEMHIDGRTWIISNSIFGDLAYRWQTWNKECNSWMFLLYLQEEFQLALFKKRKKENLLANRVLCFVFCILYSCLELEWVKFLEAYVYNVWYGLNKTLHTHTHTHIYISLNLFILLISWCFFAYGNNTAYGTCILCEGKCLILLCHEANITDLLC